MSHDPRPIAIYGAGGHGREVAEILRTAKQTIAGFLDDDPGKREAVVAGLPVLGDWSWFAARAADFRLILAQGDPSVLRALSRKTRGHEVSFAQAISPQASIASSAALGEGAIVFPQAVISTDVVVGAHCTVNTAATVSHDSELGDFVLINPGAHLAGHVQIGTGGFVGIGASIVQCVSVGEWARIGAGAAVTTDLPANVTAVGVPARIVRTREEGWYER